MTVPRAWRRLPQLVRFMTLHAAIGFGLAALLVGGLLLADPADARRLLLGAAGHWWPAAVLWFFVGLTFASVQIGVAVMLLAEGPHRPSGGGRPALRRRPVPAFGPVLVPARVAARPRPR